MSTVKIRVNVNSVKKQDKFGSEKAFDKAAILSYFSVKKSNVSPILDSERKEGTD